MTLDKLSGIVAQYGKGSLVSSSQVYGGLVNTTYKVYTDSDVLIVQQLPLCSSASALEDIHIISQYLSNHNFPAPTMLATQQGESFVNGSSLWRAFTYIEHDRDGPFTKERAFSAGAALGRLHELLSHLDHDPVVTHPWFHKPARILEKLHQAMEDPQYSEKQTLVQEEYNYLSDMLPLTYLPSDLEETLIHGDPKITNFLFKGDDVVGVVDFDCVMKGSVLLDIGDALRSWCRVPDTSLLDIELVHEAIRGYLSENKIDTSLIGQALGMITLELSCRYLIDFFEESYFSVDPRYYSSLTEQNLKKCKLYIEYYKNQEEFRREFD